MRSDDSTLGRTSSADATRRIQLLPWLLASETPGIARSLASSTDSPVSTSMKSAFTFAFSSFGVPEATNFPWSMIATVSQSRSASSM